MTTGGMPDATVKSFRNQLLSAHNDMRHRFGNGRALKIDGRLNDGAQAWSNRMASNTTLAHSSTSSWGKAEAENVGGAYSTVAGVMNAWRHSCGHFYNIVAKGFSTVGFGISKDRYGGLWFCTRFDGNPFNFCSKCPGCSCNGNTCTTGSSHAFYSNDPWKP